MRMAADMDTWGMMESGELPVVLPPSKRTPPQSPPQPAREGRQGRQRRGSTLRKQSAQAAAAVMAKATLAATPLLHAAELAHVRAVTRMVMIAHANEALAAILAALR